MPITFTCPRCSATFTVKDSLAGEKGTCKKCGESIRIPSLKAQTVAVISPARIPSEALIQVPPQTASVREIPGEFTIWKSSASQIENLGKFIALGLTALIFFVMAFFVMALWLVVLFLVLYCVALVIQTRCKTYELTNQRIKTARGVFSRMSQDIELFRIKDTRLAEPLFLRFFGRGNVFIISSDMMESVLVLEAVEKPSQLRETLRVHINEQRKTKGVREMDVR